MGDLSEHFSSSEFSCKDCGKCRLSGRLITALELLRALGPEPIKVHDGYRCPEHNRDMGGVSKSQHILGAAADIEIVGLTLQQQYDRACRVPDFRDGGVGVYDGNFIHVDVRTTKARWARVDGEYVGIERLIKTATGPDKLSKLDKSDQSKQNLA